MTYGDCPLPARAVSTLTGPSPPQRTVSTTLKYMSTPDTARLALNLLTQSVRACFYEIDFSILTCHNIVQVTIVSVLLRLLHSL